jgi:hypothetical protein
MGAQPNKFQFILNIRGVLTEVLANAPEGWLNTAVKFTRSPTYKGLFRGETLPLKFVTKAARLLRKEYYQYGTLANVRIIIKLQNPYTWGYNTIYKGKLDFSTTIDELTAFSINSISDDFGVQLNANDGTDYAIPLDVPEAINLELTPLALKEQADFIFNTSPDLRANAFFQISVVSNQQNGINPSVRGAGFLAQVPPVFDDTQPNFFFIARTNTTVKCSGSIRALIFSGGPPGKYQFDIYKTGGALISQLYDTGNLSDPTEISFSWEFAVPLTTGEKLYFYIKRVGSSVTTTGVNMQSGSMHLAYNTTSPATMCKALPASYLLGKLLQAMNTNENSGPNLPILFKSDLLTGPLSDLVFTSSDSIRTALGSIYYSGQTLSPGTYKVLSGTINYSGSTYVAGNIFPYSPTTLTFTGSGAVQKILSGFVGTVYNPGDTLQAGGTYLVGGNPGTFVTYKSVNYNVGEIFTYILGYETFSGSDDSSFVEQVGFEAQIITNFNDLFQTIYGLQGGNAAFGIEQIPNASTNPAEVLETPTIPRCFVENLDYVFRGTIGNLNAGIVDTDIKFQPAVELIPNTIKVGYKDQQYSQLNGYFEVNSEQTYTTTILNQKKELNLVIPYRADPYGIEEMRVSQNDTAASRSDNDVVMVWKKTAPENTVPLTYYHPLRGETLASITGVDSSYYNWFLSPKQNLLRGGNFLASIFYGMKGYKITLSAAPKNTAMVTIDNTGRRVAEADPINISNLPTPLFIPIYATFKPGLPNDALSMIDSVPYGFIRFTYSGKVYKKFADTISVDIGQNTEQEFKGLLTPDNDLTQLIH